MLILPAIDLQEGSVVRYVQGRLNKKIYSSDPLKTAKHWVKSGAKFLHLVDLDGAFTGIPKNLRIVKEIVKNITVPVEFGGGVRDIETIEKLLDFGIKRVILGTKAVSDKVFLIKAFSKFKDSIIVSVDAKEDTVLIKGWQSSGKGQDLVSFVKNLKSLGFKELIYTDTLKDGTLTGPNIKGIKKLLSETGMNIIASGGISSLDDISKLKKLESKGVTGVIVGKALYEGKFSLPQALSIGL